MGLRRNDEAAACRLASAQGALHLPNAGSGAIMFGERGTNTQGRRGGQSLQDGTSSSAGGFHAARPLAVRHEWQ